jgi:hypothetical protein
MRTAFAAHADSQATTDLTAFYIQSYLTQIVQSYRQQRFVK